MGLEVADSIPELDENWPLGTDPVSQGDDHLRLIKSVLKTQLGSLGETALTVTAEEINNSGMPVGAVILSASVTTPAGWLACNGQEANRGTYAALYAAIGDAFGSGNGTSTFNLPDMRNRVAGGASSTNSIGATGGKDSWTKSDIPDHDHTVSMDPGGQHTHDIKTSSYDNTSGDDRVGSKDADNSDIITSQPGGQHTHDISISSSDGAGNTADNRQATAYFNYIIKT